MTEARDIYQEVLDVLSRAILAGDGDTVLRLIPLPHAVRTMSGQIRIETAAEMIATVEGMQASLKGNGATDYIRIVDHAEFTGTDEITGEHTSHILRGGVRLVPPYRNQLTLRRAEDGTWQVSATSEVVADTRWPILLPNARRGDGTDI